MKKVLINVEFKDRYTGKKHIPGKTEKMTEARIAEIKEVNPHFVTVVGEVEDSGAKVNENEGAKVNENEGAKDNGDETKK